MAILIPRKKEFWLRKPQGAQEIDWSNVFSDGLVFMTLDGRDLVSGAFPSTDTTSLDAGDITCTQATENMLYSGLNPITTDDGVGTGDYSLFWKGIQGSNNGTASALVLQKQDDAGSPYTQTGLYGHMDNDWSHEPNFFAFSSYSTSRSNVSVSTTLSEVDVVCGSRESGTMIIRAGDAKASSSLTVRDIYDGSRDFCVGNSGKSADTESGYNSTAMAAAFNKAFSDDEYDDLRFAPYQLLKKKTSIFFMPDAGGAPTGDIVLFRRRIEGMQHDFR